MSIIKGTSFGVVYGTPSNFLSKIGTLTDTDGKLYVLHGDTSNGISQGIYMIEQNSADADGNPQIQMLSSGAYASNNNAGLVKLNYQTQNDEQNYKVDIDNSGDIFVHVPWQNDTVSSAANHYTPTKDDSSIISVSSGKYITTLIRDNKGHIIDFTEGNLPTSIANASTADKVGNTFDISANGKEITYNGSTNKTLEIKGDNNISIDSSLVNNKLAVTIKTTGLVTTNDLSTKLSNLEGALTYENSISSASELPTLGANDKGKVYVASQSFEYNDYIISAQDMFIWNGTEWNIIDAKGDVSNYKAELEWGKDISIGIVDGEILTVKLPSEPSDNKVSTSASSSKLFIIGKTDASKASASAANYNASVYIDDSALYSEGKKVLTTEQYTGTVKKVLVGTGLTSDTSDSSITSSGTLSLKIASSDEIGGVKPGTTVANDKIYGVDVSASTGAMTVSVPWTDTKVTANTSTGKIYLVGQNASTNGTTATVYKNASVYMQSGKMYAESGDISTGEAALVTAAAVKDAIESKSGVYWDIL